MPALNEVPTAAAGQVPASHSSFTDLTIYLLTKPCPNCKAVPHDLPPVAAAYKTVDEEILRQELLHHRFFRDDDGTTKLFCCDCQKSFEVPEHLLPESAAEPIAEPIAEPVKQPKKSKPVKRTSKAKKRPVAKSKKPPKVEKRTPAADNAAVEIEPIDPARSEFFQTMKAMLVTHPQALENVMRKCDSMQLHKLIKGAIAWNALPLDGRLEHTLRGALARSAASPEITLPVDAEPPISHKEAAVRLAPHTRTGTCGKRNIRKLLASGDLTTAGLGRIDSASVREYIKKKQMQGRSKN